jgi:hypothetical protein
MNKLYRLSSIIFRALYSIGALVIVVFYFVFSGLIEEEGDNSLILPFLFCVVSVFVITLFHKVSLESKLSKVLQIISFFIILITLIGCFYLSVMTFKNNGSILIAVLFAMLALASVPLIYFVARNKKYSHYCQHG